MEDLKFLTPAETLLILDPNGSKIEEFVKLTLLDLFLKEVLTFELRDSSPHYPKKNKKFRKFVSVYKNFKEYIPLKHESIFLIPFQKAPNLLISVRNLVKIAFEEITSIDVYKRKFIFNSRIKKYFSANLVQFLVGSKSINKKGLIFQNNIMQYLNDLDQEVNLNKSLSKVLEEKLLSLNGNIFLLDNIDISDFKFLSKSENNKNKTYNKSQSIYNYDVFISLESLSLSNDFNIFDSMINSIKKSIDSLESFDTGEDSSTFSDGYGDSGCAGCGGCGGCGGKFHILSLHQLPWIILQKSLPSTVICFTKIFSATIEMVA